MESLSSALAALRSSLLAGGSGVEQIFSSRFRGVRLAPQRETVLRPDSCFHISQATWGEREEPTPQAGVSEFCADLHSLLAPHVPLTLADLDCVAISEVPSATESLRTRIRFELAGQAAAAGDRAGPLASSCAGSRWQASGEWEIEWERATATTTLPANQAGADKTSPGDWKIALWRPLEMTTAEGPAVIFTDITSSAFGQDPSYAAHLLLDTNYWRAVLDKASGIDIFGNGGISVGDANGDGRDEIYLCQPQGLPNRLYRQRAPGVFEDVAAEGGVDILDNTSMALFADVLNRGRQDLIVITETSPLLFLNDGRGHFTLAREAFPPGLQTAALTGAAMADYNRDGFLDLYVCAYAYVQGESGGPIPSPYYDAHNGPPNRLYRNRGDGTFADVTGVSGLDRGNDRFSFACAWHDIDDDGWPDLCVVNDFGRNNLYRNLGNGKFEEISDGLPGHGSGMSAALADVDGDGAAEFYVSNMWVAAGERVTAEPEFRERFADIGPDRVRQFAMGNALYRKSRVQGAADRGQKQEGTRSRGYEPVPGASGAARGRWAWSSDFFDLENDGRPDLYVVNGYLSSPEPGRASLDAYLWEEVLALSPRTGVVGSEYRAAWAAISQLAHQGHPWNGGERNVLFLNSGEGRFLDVSAVSGLDFRDDGRSFAIFDFDGDGDADLVLHSRTGPQLRLLRNDLAQSNRSLALRLTAAKGNRDAIGARVEVETPAGRQVRFLSCGSGFLSQHSKEFVVGLGPHPAATRVQVRWPSGSTDQYEGLEAAYRYFLVEGQASPRRELLAKNGTRDSGPGCRETIDREGSRSVAQAIPRRFSTALVEPLPVPLPEALRENRTAAQSAASATAPRASRYTLLWLWDPAGDVAESLESFLRIQYTVASRLILWGGGSAPADVLKTLANPPWPANERFRLLWKTLLAYLYDYLRAPALPTGLLLDAGTVRQPLPRPRLVKVYWGGARSEEILKDVQGRLASGAAALPFPGRAVLCSFRRDLRTLGAGLVMAGLYPEGEIYLAQAVESNPQDADALYDLSYARQQSSKVPEAIANARAALQLRPDFPQAKNLLGVLLAQSGEHQAARELFEQATKELPDFVEAWNNLGYLLLSVGDMPRAREALKRALKLAPDYPEALNNLGILEANQGDTQQASALFRRVLALRPDNDKAANNLAVLYANEGRLQEAEEILRALFERSAEDESTFLNLVRLEFSLGKNAEAKKLLEGWLARHPDDEAAKELMGRAESGSPKTK